MTVYVESGVGIWRIIKKIIRPSHSKIWYKKEDKASKMIAKFWNQKFVIIITDYSNRLLLIDSLQWPYSEIVWVGVCSSHLRSILKHAIKTAVRFMFFHHRSIGFQIGSKLYFWTIMSHTIDFNQLNLKLHKTAINFQNSKQIGKWLELFADRRFKGNSLSRSEREVVWERLALHESVF